MVALHSICQQRLEVKKPSSGQTALLCLMSRLLNLVSCCAAGKVQVLAFANFGTALHSTGSDSSKSKGKNAVLDYSKQELSLSSEARDQVSTPGGQLHQLCVSGSRCDICCFAQSQQ